MHVPISLILYLHGSMVLEKLAFKWSTKNIKDKGLHMYAKSCPASIQLLSLLNLNQSKEKKNDVNILIWHHSSRNWTATWWQGKQSDLFQPGGMDTCLSVHFSVLSCVKGTAPVLMSAYLESCWPLSLFASSGKVGVTHPHCLPVLITGKATAHQTGAAFLPYTLCQSS